MTAQSNGFLVSILTQAAADPGHSSYGEATRCLAKFRALEVAFFDHVHPQVDVGLAMREVALAQGGAPHIFTVHGTRHISDLIATLDKLAKHLASEGLGTLSVLEAYTLLCAAHVHDAANVDTREAHPAKCRDVIAEHKALFASSAAMQLVFEVASVHGGVHSVYGKDTFRALNSDNTDPPRLPLMAAILRIGDELSENPDRVPELVAKHHPHSERSKLAFAYARSFLNFDLRKDNLYLTFGVYPDAATLTVTDDGRTVTFFDFLEGKLDVIDRESRYCSQYGRPLFHIGRICVTIHVYEGPVPSRVRETLSFDWQLFRGYPSAERESVCERSPELKARGIKRLQDCFQGAERGQSVRESA